MRGCECAANGKPRRSHTSNHLPRNPVTCHRTLLWRRCERRVQYGRERVAGDPRKRALIRAAGPLVLTLAGAPPTRCLPVQTRTSPPRCSSGRSPAAVLRQVGRGGGQVRVRRIRAQRVRYIDHRPLVPPRQVPPYLVPVYPAVYATSQLSTPAPPESLSAVRFPTAAAVSAPSASSTRSLTPTAEPQPATSGSAPPSLRSRHTAKGTDRQSRPAR